LYNGKLIIILDFSAINVYNVLGRRSTSTSQNLHWIYLKVFNSKLNLLKLVFDLFHDFTLMKVQQATKKFGMWILCDALDEDHSPSLYHWLLGPGMKMCKL